MTRTGRLLVATVALATAATMASCGGTTPAGQAQYDSTTVGPHGQLGYPLASLPPGGFATHAKVGDEFTNGQLIIFDSGDTDLTLVKVTPTLTGSGLRYLGARLAGTGRKLGSTQEEHSFPPTARVLGPLQQANGAVLHTGGAWAKRGVEVLLGFKVVGTGRSTVPKVSITYRDHNGEHTASFTSTMAVCTSPKNVKCAQEYGDYHD